MDWAGRFHDELVELFLTEYRQVPRFPEESELVNREVRDYADALGNWVRACDQWSFEVRTRAVFSRNTQPGTVHRTDRVICHQSERYFGKDGARVFKERAITLRPKVELSPLPAHDLAMAVDKVDCSDSKVRRGVFQLLSLLLIGAIYLAVGGVGLHPRSLQWQWR